MPNVRLSVVLLLTVVCASANASTCVPLGGTLQAAGNVTAEMRDSSDLTIGSVSSPFNIAASVLDPLTATISGTYKTRISCIFESADGSRFTVVGSAELTPSGTGSYGVTSTGPVSGGTGSYTGATGDVTLKGTISFEPAQLQGSLSGSICR